MAGVYNDEGGLPTLAQQIQRIHEKKLIARVFPGDSSHGQASLHLEDLVDAFAKVIEKRREIPKESVFLIGEEEVPSYAELQREVGKLLYGEPWDVEEIPKAVARSGAWLQEVALPEEKEPFIKHWMVDLADDHYELDISQAERLLGWEPKHRLLKTLPNIVGALKRDPQRWYKQHKLDYPGDDEREKPDDRKQERDKSSSSEQAEPKRGESTQDDMLITMHQRMLWPHYVNMMLGFWLLTSPFLLGYSAHTYPMRMPCA